MLAQVPWWTYPVCLVTPNFKQHLRGVSNYCRKGAVMSDLIRYVIVLLVVDMKYKYDDDERKFNV